ncbi:MAG: Smr/MutS family protein [Thiomicrorhabdus chilensis]|uniref:Smr/MutS family protein n=1 Tax=Thiomicrorhabdus chilensis TaxID=63656 RepID=UPI00299E7D2B|nr:Smr/MutS family protein [Thiomicrorhabdus chilensis]MDX1348228.1 Smr/MutS family protein [Thiomicrorhabdus chilensis]
MSRLSEEEKSLFNSAMQDVQPLKQKAKVSLNDAIEPENRYQQTMRQVRNKNRQHQSDEVHLIGIDEPADSVGAYDSLLFHRKGMRLQDLAKLKKGEFPIEASLDLHGMTEEAADQALQLFIERLYRAKKRSLLVIHGKGYNSETSGPVLKNLANRRLRQLKAVLAFSSCLPKDGGTGSLYVLLKAH